MTIGVRLPRWTAVVWSARTLLVAELALAIAVLAYAAVHDVRDVFSGTPPPVSSRIRATCGGEESPGCSADIVPLNDGRYRVDVRAETAVLTVTVSPVDASHTVRDLLVRVSRPSRLHLDVKDVLHDGGSARVELVDSDGRVLVPVRANSELVLRFTADRPAPIAVEELGLYDTPAGLLSDTRPIFTHIPPLRYHATLVMRAAAALCVFMLTAGVLLRSPLLARLQPALLAVLCVSLCVLELAVLFSPYFARDIRAFYAGGPLTEPPGANLNTGLWQGFRLLGGHGLTLVDGKIAWERMPGYGLWCALAGLVFGHGSLVALAVSTVALQVALYAGAVAAFAAAARGVFGSAAIWAAGIAIAWLPKAVGMTQVDVVIAPIALLILAALCIRLRHTRQGEPIPLWTDVVVHAAFSVWFVMRPDILPAWMFVSLYLHRRTWRRLLVPALLFLTIGVGWGAYKARFTHEFSITTTSAGASLFCGLWEVPSRFRYAEACTDETYFDWIQRETPFQPQSAAANQYAMREVLRFWATYPGHLVVMVYHKMMRMLDGDVWPGYPTQLQTSLFAVTGRYGLVMLLVAVVMLCAIVGYERERTFLMVWPLLFNAPIFWLTFASLGRFYAGAGVALVAGAVPPLFEARFYTTLGARPLRALAVVVCVFGFALTAWRLDAWLLGNNSFHYWTPLLDPSSSTLSAFK